MQIISYNTVNEATHFDILFICKNMHPSVSYIFSRVLEFWRKSILPIEKQELQKEIYKRNVKNRTKSDYVKIFDVVCKLIDNEVERCI